MAKAPDFRRLAREDIDIKKSDWADKLINPINAFFEQTQNILTGNLTVEDNVYGKILNISFATPSTYSTGAFNEFEVPWNKIVNAKVVLIGQIMNRSGITITEPVFITDWIQYNQATIKINYITGLLNSSRYDMTLLVL